MQAVVDLRLNKKPYGIYAPYGLCMPPRLYVIYVCLGVERAEPRIKRERVRIFSLPYVFSQYLQMK
jgi:hypothetical protein